MYKGIESILIGSEKPKALADFYKEKVGLNQTAAFVMGEGEEENAFSFEMDGTSINILEHSEVKGKNSDQSRIMFNIEVDQPIEEVVKKLDENGVKKVTDTYHVEGYGHVATFEDLDGNYFQIVQVRDL